MWKIRTLKSIRQWGTGNKYDKMATYFFATRKKLNIEMFFCLFVYLFLAANVLMLYHFSNWVVVGIGEQITGFPWSYRKWNFKNFNKNHYQNKQQQLLLLNRGAMNVS